jgi:hypothetical protein
LERDELGFSFCVIGGLAASPIAELRTPEADLLIGQLIDRQVSISGQLNPAFFQRLFMDMHYELYRKYLRAEARGVPSVETRAPNHQQRAAPRRNRI